MQGTKELKKQPDLPDLRKVSREKRRDFHITTEDIEDDFGIGLNWPTRTCFGRYIPQMNALRQHAESKQDMDSRFRVLCIGLGMFSAVGITEDFAIGQWDDIFKRRDINLTEDSIPTSMRRPQTTQHLEVASAIENANIAREGKHQKPLDWKVDVLELDQDIIDIARGQTVVMASNADVLNEFYGTSTVDYVRDFIPSGRRRPLKYSGVIDRALKNTILPHAAGTEHVFEAVKIPGHYHDRIGYMQADIEKTEVERETNDVVFFNMGALHYLKDNAQTFAKLVGSLKMGGVIYTDQFELAEDSKDGKLGCKQLGLEFIAEYETALRPSYGYRRVKSAEVDLAKVNKSNIGEKADPDLLRD